MKKALKITLGIIIAVILLFIVAIVIVATTVDPNDYKAQITQEVKKTTGRELTIGGDIQWAFFPWIGLSVDSVTLGNPNSFKPSEKPLIHIKRAQISIELLPLIIGRFNIGTLTLDAPVIHLVTLKQGQHNWDFSKPKSKQVVKTSTKQSAPANTIQKAETYNQPEKSTDSDTMPVNIEHVQVRDATIVWDNRNTKQFITIDNFQLSSGQIGFGDEFPIETSFDINSKQPQGTGHFRLTGDVMLAPKKEQYEFSSLVVSLAADSSLLQGGRVALSANTDLLLDLNKQWINIKKLKIKLDQMQLNANVKGSFDLTKPDLQGSIKLSKLNLKKVMGLLQHKLTTPEESALTDINFDTEFEVNHKKIDIDEFELTLDGNPIKLDLSADNQKKTAKFDFSANKINLDHYLPLKLKSVLKSKPTRERTKANISSGNSKTKTTSTQTSDGMEPLFAILRPFTASGEIAVKQIQVENIIMNNLTADINAKKGIIDLDPIKAEIYNGKYQSQLIINIQKPIPNITIKENIKTLELGGLLKAMTGNSMLTGQLNGDFSGNTRGLSIDQLIANLNGQLKFDINDGILHGIDIAEQLKIVSQFISKGFKSNNNTGGGRTVFDEISGTGNIKHGVMSNNDLVLRSKRFRVDGNGIVNFNTQGINYNLGIRQGSSRDPIFQTLSAIGSGEVPLKVTGTLSNPSVSPDWNKLQKQLINVHGKKLLEDTGKALEGAGKSLKNLINF